MKNTFRAIAQTRGFWFVFATAWVIVLFMFIFASRNLAGFVMSLTFFSLFVLPMTLLGTNNVERNIGLLLGALLIIFFGWSLQLMEVHFLIVAAVQFVAIVVLGIFRSE